MNPAKRLDDALFRERVLRARQMTPEQRVLEGFRLFEQECLAMRADVRAQHPDADEQRVEEILTERLRLLRRLEEEDRYLPVVVVRCPAVQDGE